MIEPISPEVLIIQLLEHKINPDGYTITKIMNMKKINENYKILLSKIKSNFNGVFYYSEMIEECLFNFQFCDAIFYNWYKKNYEIINPKSFECLKNYHMKNINDETNKTIKELILDIQK